MDAPGHGIETVESLRETLVDLEQQRAYEACIRRDNELLLRGLRTLSLAQTPEAMFADLFGLLRDAIGCTDVFALHTDEDGELGVVYSTDAAFDNDAWLRGALFERVTGGKVVAAFDVGRVEEWAHQPAAVMQKVTSALHGPLQPGGRPGMLVATSRKRGYFAQKHIEVMQQMLLLVGQALFQVEVREAQARERELLVHRDALQRMVDVQTADLIEAKQAAVDANESKGRLVAGLTHELRSPLHAIIGFSDLAHKADPADSERLMRYFDRINESGRTLLTLVDQLLDLAKMESGSMAFEFEAADLAGLGQGVVDEFESLAAQKKVALRTDFEPVVGDIDVERMRQVLRNLISNGLKFSPPGAELRVGLSVEAGQVLIRVDDSGEGVADDDKTRVFDSYVQTASGAAKPGSTGLGLTTCRMIVRAHGGRIWVEDADGGGASFRVAIPREQVPERAAAAS